MVGGKTFEILTEEQRKALLESRGLDEKRLKESRDSILEWCSKEEHLKAAVPYLAKTAIVDRQLLLTKGSVEETKVRIDAVLRTRATTPELCLNRELSQFDCVLKYVKFVQMPKIIPNTLERVTILKYLPVENYDDFDLQSMYKLVICMIEHRIYDDISIADRFIVDMANTKPSILAKFSPSVIKQCLTMAHTGIGSKFNGTHILNAPFFFDKVLFLFKQLMKPKLAERFYLHTTIEELYESIPKEVLPSDLNGEGPSFDELYDKWVESMKTEETKQKTADLDKIVSDESKRLNTKFDQEQMGMPGNFKKLDLD